LVTPDLRPPSVAQVGQYQLIEEIGRGGMALVYRAHHRGLGIDVAVKLISTHFASDQSFVERFRVEAQSVARLRHPNILQVYDFGEDEGVAYLVSQFVEGGSLWDKLGSPLPAHYVNQVVTKVASALDYAHSQGILHRDIKPSNILLTKEGDPILADFGLAKILERPSNLTDVGTILGSPEYMSPEQALGQDLDERSDVYALAVVLYEMLTGSPPFEGETPTRTILAHAYDAPPTPRTRNPNLSEQTERVLLKALAKDPNDRYQRAGELVHALKVASITLSSNPRAGSWPPKPFPLVEATPSPSGARPAPAPVAVEPAKLPRRRFRQWWPALAALPVAALLVASTLYALNPARSAGTAAGAPAVPSSGNAAVAPPPAGDSGDPIIVVIAPFDDSFASKKINVGQRINDRLILELNRQGLKNVDLLPLPGGNSAAPKIKALEATRDLPASAVLLVWGWYDDSEVSPHVVLLKGYLSPELGNAGADVNLPLGGSGDEVLNKTLPTTVSDQVARMVKLLK
jgi:serine/threonine-protein kinase